jgi:hypothetical protein
MIFTKKKKIISVLMQTYGNSLRITLAGVD